MSKDQYGIRYEEGFGPKSTPEDYESYARNGDSEGEEDYAFEMGIQEVIGTGIDLDYFKSRLSPADYAKLEATEHENTRLLWRALEAALHYERTGQRLPPVPEPVRPAPFAGVLPDEFYLDLPANR